MRDFLDDAPDVDAVGSVVWLALTSDLSGAVCRPSFDLRRLDLRRDESRGACCGDVSADVLSEDGLSMSVFRSQFFCDGPADPALDIAADAALFLPLFGASTGSGCSWSASGLVAAALLPRGRLVLRSVAGGDGCGAALRLRLVEDEEVVVEAGGEPAAVVVGDCCWLLMLSPSAESLAAAERVTR